MEYHNHFKSSLQVSEFNIIDNYISLQYLIQITTANHPLLSLIGDYVPRAVVFGLITRNPYVSSPQYNFL